MAISSTGIGSGLDIAGIVSKLMAVEQRPLTQLKSKGSTLTTKVSSWGTVKSQLASLQDAANRLMGLTSWTGRTFTSSNTTALSGSATSSTAVGSYSVNVTQLAKNQMVRSGSGIATGTGIGQTGTLEISLGTWSGSSFAASGDAINVSISETDTMSAVASKINAAKAGVTATVVSSNGQDHLVIRGQSTGVTQGFQIRAFGEPADPDSPITDGTGLGALAYGYDDNTQAFYGLTLGQAAQNAAATIDGIPVTSTTNTLANAIAGLTLNLQETTASPVTVTVGQNTDTTRTAIQGFVDAYNTLTKTLANLTRYDQATSASGPLQGDSTAVGLLNTMKRMVGSLGPAGTSFSRLSDIGLELQRDGTLSVNNAKLNAALDKPDDLRTFFAATSSDNTNTGLARRFYDYAFGANATQGVVTQRNSALQKAITRNNSEIDRLNDRISRTEERLYKTYSALDTKMGALSSLSQYVSQQINTWNKS